MNKNLLAGATLFTVALSMPLSAQEQTTTNENAATANQYQPVPVPEIRKIRLFISTDAKNEADDQFAIVQAILTPKFKIKGIISSQYSKTAKLMERNAEGTMDEGYAEIQKVVGLMDLATPPAIYHGAKHAIKDEKTAEVSEGAKAIVAEAMKDDKTPLYVISLGPITDLASAYLLEPKIASKVTAVWIGGGDYPKGGWEYNLFNDPSAANVIFKSKMPVWQVPRAVYSTMRTSLSELTYKVKPHGKIGAYLVDQMETFNEWASNKFPTMNWPKGESWSLGDNPAVSVLLDEHEYGYKDQPVYVFDQKSFEYKKFKSDKKIRVYSYVDPRFTLEDMFAKIALAYPAK